MKKFLIIILLILIMVPKPVFATQDPLSRPNNKVGVHILFPSEIFDAAKLINSSGGDWGYVTIPIQAGDRDLNKWQTFMDEARALHVVPILRLSSENDYFNTVVWRKPTDFDVLDFANFLNSLNWPTKNKYVVVFNEPNRADEWGGHVDPADYANLLSYAVTVFKSKDKNFFIISAGLDNASINSSNSMDEFYYMRAMNVAVPGIFYQIDGLGSHSYPNPAFSAPPTKIDGESINSFSFEQQIASQLGSKNNLPVFITETGWSDKNLPDSTIASYFTKAYNSVWSNSSVVAVTPFILNASSGPFTDLSLIRSNNSFTKQYLAIQNMPKTKGLPILASKSVLGIQTTENKNIPIKNFQNFKAFLHTISVPKNIKLAVKWLLNI